MAIEWIVNGLTALVVFGAVIAWSIWILMPKINEWRRRKP